MSTCQTQAIEAPITGAFSPQTFHVCETFAMGIFHCCYREYQYATSNMVFKCLCNFVHGATLLNSIYFVATVKECPSRGALFSCIITYLYLYNY